MIGDKVLMGSRRFDVKRRLGAGSMGVVYEAFDREQNETVAIKTLRRTDADTLLRLKNEFRGLQGIEHPNLVSLGELIEESGTWLFTMELVEGVDFLSYVRSPEPGAPLDLPTDETQPASDAVVSIMRPRGGVCDEKRLRGALRQLALGLAALHAADRVHRDIKPANIRITPAGRLVVLDFGLITEVGPTSQSSDGHFVGTVAYVAPEQAASGQASPAADWYSFGVLLYEALTGTVPHSGRTVLEVLLNKRDQQVPPPHSFADVPRDLEELCLDLLQLDPDDRPTGASILTRLGADVSVPPRVRTLKSTLQPTFVGRTVELALLRTAFESTTRGQASTVVVNGESGVGKTALLRQFVRQVSAEFKSLVVLSGRCYERESVPYKALDGVVDALSRFLRGLPEPEAARLVPRNASLLARVFPVLARVEVIAGAPRPRQDITDPHELRLRAFGALRELLVRLAEEYTVIVVIDDLQWADADSFVLLGDLLLPPDSPQLLLMLSVRTESREAAAIELPGNVSHVKLDSLAPSEAEQLARTLLGASPHRDGAIEIATEARGHPMFIDELCRRAMQTRSGDKAPLRLDEALWERASELPAFARRVLEVVAVGEMPMPQAVVRRAARVEQPEFGRAMSILRTARLVRGHGSRDDDLVEPYHDRVREAMWSRTEAADLRNVHARLATALESAGVAARRPELLLRHFEGAGDTGKAADYAIEAAKRAEDALAFDRAVDFYRAALRLRDHGPQERCELKGSLAIALSCSGHARSAAEEFVEASIGADPATRREYYTRAAEQFLIAGHIERGLAVINELLADVGERLAGSPRRVLLDLIWQRLKIWLRGLTWTERHEREVAPSELARVSVYQAVGEGLAAVDTVRGAASQSRGLLLALRLGEPKRVARALAMEGVLVASLGAKGRRRAQDIISRALEVAERAGDPEIAAISRVTAGYQHFAIGEFNTVRLYAEQALEVFRHQRATSRFWLNNIHLINLITCRYLGNFRQQLEQFRYLVRDAERRGDLYMATSLRRACSFVWLAADRPDDARRDLERSAWAPPSAGFHLQHWYETWARSELALYEGRGAEEYLVLSPQFDALFRSLLVHVEIVRVFALQLRGGLALAAAVRHPGALRDAAACARRLRRIGLPYTTLGANVLDATIAYRRGQTETAIGLLRSVVSDATEHLPLGGEVSRRRLGELIGGSEGAEMIAQADEWMIREGIVSPSRIMAVLTPGFEPRGLLEGT